MKNLKTSLGIIALIAAAVFSSQSLPAATPIWNAPAGGNWSVPANWNPTAIPDIADDVQFGNVGAGNQNTMDASFTIDSLTYNQDDGLLHTTVLNPGFTLNVTRTTTGDPLTVSSTTAAVNASTQVPATIQGAGATLNVNGAGNIVVRQGFSASAGSHMATLDMSGLDTFNANVGRLLIGQANNGDTPGNRPSGTLLLAKTNVITLTSATAPQVVVQDGGQNANGGTTSVLRLGQVTVINADSYRLGGQKGNGNANFNPAFSNPSLVIRNHDTVSRAVQIFVGDNGLTSSGNSTAADVDWSAGSVDILVESNVVARGNPGPGTGTCAGTLRVGAGTFDVNTLDIGFGIASGANGAATGTMLVSNNGMVTTNSSSGLVSTGAVVSVNTLLRLALTNGGTGAIVGTLTLSGGTVLANRIVSGGGNSTINLNAGSLLVISNNAGTLAAPIRTFNITDAAITLPAQNAGGVLAVSNLLTGGQNTINISAVPPIGSYPATFSLVSYVSGAGGTFVLGSLPAGGYAGSLVDLGNGVIQLRLTAGPTADLSVLWTGASGGDWDTSSINWTAHGNPTNFFSGATPIFNDTGLQTNVNLAIALSSGTITVSNNVTGYDFSGVGNIAGASSLVKKGSQILTIENQGVDNFGSVIVSGGTLQIGSGDVNGEISSLNITNDAAIVVNRSGAIGLSSAIAGIGSLTKIGNGTLTLSGASTYSGLTTLTAGGLQINGSISGSGALTTAAGTLLGGGGTVAGPVTVGGAFNPGAVNTPGTFTSGAMTLSSGSTVTFDLSASDPSNPAANDNVVVGGNLNVNNNTIIANILGVPSVGNNYPLITYSGTLFGAFNPTVTGSHFTLALDTNTLGTVSLQVSGGSGANLKWTGATDTTWDSTVMNWADLSSSVPSLFFSGDNVLLDDTAGQPNLIIGAGVSVYPATITNNSDNNSYSISGAGKISGPVNIVKLGASTLTIATANDFTGTVDIQNGVLKASTGSALGAAATGTTVEPGGTLDIGGQSLGGETITIAGDGFNGQGALINSGGVQGTALRSLVLSSNASVGGTGQFSINNSGGAGSLSTLGQPYKLTKVGPNQFGLQNLTTVDPALGEIEVQQGILEFNGLTPNMGDPLHTNTVDAGATLQFTADSVVWNKFFNFNGNGSANTVNNGASANTELAGPVELHGGVIFNVGGTLMTISSVISGDGSLTKIGTTPMILTSNNTYTGDTTINVGVIRLGGVGSISNSPNITIAGGSTLTVTGRVDATFTLVGNQTLLGNGVVNGQVVTLAGSTVSPGIGGIGALTVSNALTLGGTNLMELNQDAATNDVVNVNSSIAYGGILKLVNIGSALTNGASFKLFKALSYGGAFASIDPVTPAVGQTWDTSALSSGIIKVAGSAAGPTTNANITSVKVTGTNIVLHGVNNNLPNTNFHYAVLISTNLTLPLGSWTPVVTNPFNSDGTFDYSYPIVPATAPRLFIDVKAVP